MTDRDTHSLFEQAKALLTEKSDILSCVRGISLLKQAAGRGDTACLCLLGDQYRSGCGEALEKDLHQSFQCYRRAWEQFCREEDFSDTASVDHRQVYSLCSRLGQCMLHGLGTLRNYESAERFFENAIAAASQLKKRGIPEADRWLNAAWDGKLQAEQARKRPENPVCVSHTEMNAKTLESFSFRQLHRRFLSVYDETLHRSLCSRLGIVSGGDRETAVYCYVDEEAGLTFRVMGLFNRGVDDRPMGYWDLSKEAILLYRYGAARNWSISRFFRYPEILRVHLETCREIVSCYETNPILFCRDLDPLRSPEYPADIRAYLCIPGKPTELVWFRPKQQNGRFFRGTLLNRPYQPYPGLYAGCTLMAEAVWMENHLEALIQLPSEEPPTEDGLPRQ